RPGPEREAQGEHVGVGAHSRIAEQVPRPADPRARFEDDEAFARAALLEAASNIDAGNPGADDQHVDVLTYLHVRKVAQQACFAQCRALAATAGDPAMEDVMDKVTTSPISTRKHGDVLIILSNNPPVNALGAAVRQGLVAAIEQ